MLLSAKDFHLEPHPIASGSYGTVRIAMHKRNHTLHAAKTLLRKDPLKGDRTGLLLGEIRNQARVSGPHVCKLHGYFEDVASITLVQELCTGGSLEERISATWANQDIKVVARGLLAAAQDCYEQDIIHGDIKPSNIMFANNLDVRLIDFGSSVVCKQGQDIRCHSGTPAYASPEARRKALVNKSSDVWACGTVLYQLLNRGQLPDSQLTLPPWTPIEARDLVLCMLQQDPTKRIHPYEAMGHPFFKH